MAVMGRILQKYVCFVKLSAKYCFIVPFFPSFSTVYSTLWETSLFYQFCSFFLLADVGTPLPHPSSCCNWSHDPFALFFCFIISPQLWEQCLLVNCSTTNLAKWAEGQQYKPYILFFHWWYCMRCLRNTFCPCFSEILYFHQPWECCYSQ